MRPEALFKSSTATVLFILLLFGATAYACGGHEAFSSAARLTTASTFDLQPKLHSQNNELHSIFLKTINQTSVVGDLYYKKNTGAVWKASQKVASNVRAIKTGFSGHSITSYNGKAHVAYTVDDGDSEVVYKTNAGGSWPASSTRITKNTGIQDFQPTIVTLAGKLYVVFVRKPASGDSELYYSENLSGSWSEPKAITNNTVEDSAPSIVAKNGKIYLAWVATGANSTSIKYRVFENAAWSNAQSAIASSTTVSYQHPKIALYSGKPHIAYRIIDTNSPVKGPKTGIGFSYLTANGWKKKNIIPLTSDDYEMEPSISNLGNKFRVTWQRGSRSILGPSHIMFATLNGIASNWGVSYIPDSNRFSTDPSIATDSNGSSHIVYSGDSDEKFDSFQMDIFHRQETLGD